VRGSFTPRASGTKITSHGAPAGVDNLTSPALLLAIRPLRICTISSHPLPKGLRYRSVDSRFHAKGPVAVRSRCAAGETHAQCERHPLISDGGEASLIEV